MSVSPIATLSGVGLHYGHHTTVTLRPGEAGSGINFIRIDLGDKPLIPVNLTQISSATLSTELGQTPAKVRTVEHLLSALFTHGVTDLVIEIDGAEVPLLDGSAKMWSDAIADYGTPGYTLSQSCPHNLTVPISVYDRDSFVLAMPATELCFTYGIDFPYGPIGQQWHSWYPDRESFAETIAPARTFGFADQIEQLRQAGLIQGGSLDNALVCDREQWLNPPLRFPNEPVRHKLLDLVGDLSLLGALPRAHYVAYKASHQLHLTFAQNLHHQL